MNQQGLQMLELADAIVDDRRRDGQLEQERSRRATTAANGTRAAPGRVRVALGRALISLGDRLAESPQAPPAAAGDPCG
jgi:hypothetical protein